MIAYEHRLDQDPNWAFLEGSMHFEKNSAVHNTLKKIARRLDDLGIAYAVAGGMALFFHGHRRFTEDVDILITKQDLSEVHRQLEGLGYLPLFTGSRNLRDTEHGTRIEFIVTGDFPGDGKPKPVAFPDPKDVRIKLDDIYFLSLPALIELKLASGVSHPRRGQDLVDVQELIDSLALPEDLSNQLDPYVAAKYRELWTLVQEHPKEKHDRR